MAINTAEIGLTNGSTPTNAQTSGGTGNFAFVVAHPNTGQFTVDSSGWKHRGTFSYKHNCPGTSDYSRGEITLSSNAVATDIYFCLDTLPTLGDARLIQIIATSGSVYVAQRTDGRLSLFNAKIEQVWVSTTVYAAGSVIRASLGVSQGTKDASTGVAPFDGTLRLHIFTGANLDSAVAANASDSFSSTTANTGNLTFVGIRWGNVSTQQRGAIHSDDIQYVTGSTAIIGGVTGAAPTISLSRKRIERVDASNTSSYDTLALTWKSGPQPVTITGPTAGIFEAEMPGTMSGPTVLTLTATGGGVPVTQDITIQPVGSGANPGTDDYAIWDGTKLVRP